MEELPFTNLVSIFLHLHKASVFSLGLAVT